MAFCSSTRRPLLRPSGRRRVPEELLSAYGKSILFDYSYRYFYGDGYGKTFRVLNLKRASASKAHELMLGGLLIFYQQAMLHRRRWEEARAYNIEKLLWVLLGTSVSRKRRDEKDSTKTAEEERTDVGEVPAFVRRFLEDPEWANVFRSGFYPDFILWIRNKKTKSVREKLHWTATFSRHRIHLPIRYRAPKERPGMIWKTSIPFSGKSVLMLKKSSHQFFEVRPERTPPK